jgi:hypothetical protein
MGEKEPSRNAMPSGSGLRSLGFAPPLESLTAQMSMTSSQLPDDTQPMTVLPSAANAEAQALWFAAQRRPWASLVVLPAGPGESGLTVANALYDVGALVSGGPMRLLDARNLTLASSASFIVNMSSLVSAPGERRTGGPQRVVVVLSSVHDEPAGVPVVLAADAVVLTVTLGKTTLDSARRTLELVGAEHILGYILVTD